MTRVAIHEAAHVVMHYLERVPFESVTIVPDSALGSDGAVHPRLGPLWLWDRQRVKTLRILMAGKVAEEFHTGKPGARTCGHDLNLAACIAGELADEGNGDADALLAAAYVAARSTLAAASVWAAVEALASALVTRQTLNKAQAYRIIRGALLPSCTHGSRDSGQRCPARRPHVVADGARDDIEVHSRCRVALERAARIAANRNDAAGCE
jgi:hypothetical protein